MSYNMTGQNIIGPTACEAAYRWRCADDAEIAVKNSLLIADF